MWTSGEGRSGIMSTMDQTSQRLLVETTAAKERAEALLEGLLHAKATTERIAEEQNRSDAFKQVTGKSAMDNAIASTRRMIDSLDRAIEQMRRKLSAEDLAAIDRE